MQKDALNNVHISAEQVLITPEELKNQFPLSADDENEIATARNIIANILQGRDHRLLVVCGPCSIHDPDAALDYARRLKTLAADLSDQLYIVMRVYFEKPRTTVGWKGLINDPYMDGSFDVEAGLHIARRLLLDLVGMGLPLATEALDPNSPQYLGDLLSWSAIGARTTESQTHREMASGLSMPVGFKNGTDGNTRIAIDAIRAARAGHMFLSPDKHGQMTIYQTSGNPYGHIIMRGGKTPNYHARDIAAACDSLREFDLPEHLVIDFSHGNCQKMHRRQLEVVDNVCQQIRAGSAAITGVMAESFLVEGTQKIVAGQPLTYGQSITDPCLSWSDSEQLLAMLADAIDSRF